MASDFPYFLQFKSEFCNKELMMWATATSWSCFYWLYRASSSSVAKNIINLIFAWTIWWCPCVESSLVLLEEGVCYNQCVLLTKLSAFALFHYVLQGQTCLLLQLSLDFQLLPFNPLWKKKDTFYWCYFYNVLQVFIELFNFSFFSISGWGLDLDYCDIEWFALETNRDRSVIFEITCKDCISDSFTDYENYSTSSKGFLPTVVDITIIWIRYSINFHLFVDIQLLKITYIWKIVSIDIFLESGILFGIWLLFKCWWVFILTNMGKTR